MDAQNPENKEYTGGTVEQFTNKNGQIEIRGTLNAPGIFVAPLPVKYVFLQRDPDNKREKRNSILQQHGYGLKERESILSMVEAYESGNQTIGAAFFRKYGISPKTFYKKYVPLLGVELKKPGAAGARKTKGK